MPLNLFNVVSILETQFCDFLAALCCQCVIVAIIIFVCVYSYDAICAIFLMYCCVFSVVASIVLHELLFSYGTGMQQLAYFSTSLYESQVFDKVKFPQDEA